MKNPLFKCLRGFSRVGGMLMPLLLTACATFSPDGGFATVENVARERLDQDVAWARDDATQESIQARVRDLLKAPLSANNAVQIALLNNRELQATYAKLGIAEAELVRTGRLPNPGFSYARLRAGDITEIERGLHFNLGSFLTLPFAHRIEKRRFEQTQLAVAGSMLAVAAETRKTYLRALAARETTAYLEQVVRAAEASAELAERMARAGNWSRRDQAREHAFYAEATVQLARARQTALGERERLTRLMGLWGEAAQFELPERMPELPADVRTLTDVEQTALTQRLDVQLVKREAESVAQSLGLTKATRFINVLELGYLLNSETGEPRQTGYEITLELPLFDFGTARTARAEAVYMAALNRAANVAVNARSQAREAYAGYRTAYDVAKHYRDEIVPLRKRISQENRLRYNGMLISVFELLADARVQAAAVSNAIEALRDFWLAEADLQMALSGISPGEMTRPAAATLAAGAATPAH